MSRDLVLGSTTLAIAGGYYAMAASIPESLLADAVGPKKLPQVYAILLAGLSLVLIVRSLAAGPPLDVARGALSDSRRAKGPALPAPASWRAAALLAIGVAYIVAVPWLGYALSLGCLIIAAAYCQGGRLDRRMLAIAASGAVCFWLLFVELLGVPQPPGVWSSLF